MDIAEEKDEKKRTIYKRKGKGRPKERRGEAGGQ